MRTGPDFREQHVLDDGTRVTLRHIRPGDGPALRRSFYRLSPESLYRRFFGGVSELTDATVRYLTQVDGHDHVAIVATRESPHIEADEGLGVARFVRLREEPTVAEAAVTVVDDMQRKGVGRLLATVLAEAARERGVRTLRADVLADNGPMRAIMNELGAVERGAEAGVITYDVALDALPGARGGPLDRILRAAAESVGVLLRRMMPPAER